VFYKGEAGDIFHTCSADARGTEALLTSDMVLDMTPKGRNEAGPGRNLTDGARRHDEYADAPRAGDCCRAEEGRW
jgi:predicted dithiol-disulfide oxidoreductase (DUF899 family)